MIIDVRGKSCGKLPIIAMKTYLEACHDFCAVCTLEKSPLTAQNATLHTPDMQVGNHRRGFRPISPAALKLPAV